MIITWGNCHNKTADPIWFLSVILADISLYILEACYTYTKYNVYLENSFSSPPQIPSQTQFIFSALLKMHIPKLLSVETPVSTVQDIWIEFYKDVEWG